MRLSERQLASEMAQTSRAIHQRGWVANHDGNLTVRLGADRFLATPTSVSKGAVDESMLIVVDRRRRVLKGHLRPFSELSLHFAAYDTRDDVTAVVHAHPPTATAFAVAGQGLDQPMIAEAVVSLGPRVPLAPYALPGTPETTRGVAELLSTYDAVLLENHGVLTVGSSLEQAYLRMELVEHLARIEWRARQIGNVQYLDQRDVLSLLDKREAAGLGPRVRGLPDAPPTQVTGGDRSALRRIVAEELRAVLKKGGS